MGDIYLSVSAVQMQGYVDIAVLSYYLVVGCLRCVVTGSSCCCSVVCGSCPFIVFVLFYVRVPDVLQLCCSDVFALV